MVSLRYPLYDMIRRRIWAGASIFCSATAVGSQILLALTSLAVNQNMTLLASTVPSSLHILYSRLLIFLTLLSIISGASVLVTLSCAFSWERRKDIAIMKASGLGGEVGAFFISEVLLSTSIGACLGVVVSVPVYFVLKNAFWPTLSSWGLPPFWLVSGILLISLLLCFLSSYLPLWSTIARLRTASAFTLKRSWFTEFILRVLGRRLTLRFSVANLVTRKRETLTTMFLVALSLTVVSITLFGGHIAHHTAQSYIEKGVGSGVFLVATPELAQAYLEHLSFGDASNTPIYLTINNRIPESFIAWLETQHGLGTVDYRLVAETKAIEIAFIEPLLGPSYRKIGDERSVDVMVVGLHPQRTIEHWVNRGRLLEQDDTGVVVIGDSVLTIFTDYSLEKVCLWGRSLPIIGIVVDPLNMGRTVYLPYESLREMLGVDGPNIAVFEGGTASQEVLRKVMEEATRYGLTVVALEGIVDKNLEALERFWSFIAWIPSSGLVSSVIALSSYFVVSIHARAEDFRILKAIGLTWKQIMHLLLFEVVFILSWPSFLGITIGLTFCNFFLTTSPVTLPLGMFLFDLATVSTYAISIGLASSVVGIVSLKKALV